jgi:NADH-quinone oxidoreductase subunit L
VLLVIAYVGCITLFIAATIAVTATDIKRVLAYSTVSQLGYMMLALGVGGWIAGLFHLLTHAFFKSLLFMGSGSVIHACGTNEMPEMGGLRKRMPWTAYTMLAGCLAISGAGVPLVAGLSGFYSKDSILAQAYSFKAYNPMHAWLFYAAAAGAAITAFYMFRFWYMTFAGPPRVKPIYDHAHESPRVMTAPLVLLAVLAVAAGWRDPVTGTSITGLLEQAVPAGTAGAAHGGLFWPGASMPAEHLSHAEEVHLPVSLIAFGTALVGFLLATAFYGTRALEPNDVRRQFYPLYWFFRHKWFFDELYRAAFVRPTLWIARRVADLDRLGIDWVADGLARLAAWVARLDDWFDRRLVDGGIDRLAESTYALGMRLRTVQTGQVRQYVVYIVVGTVALFVLISLYWNFAVAGTGL